MLFEEKPELPKDGDLDLEKYTTCEINKTPSICGENAECVVDSTSDVGFCICRYGFYGDGIDCKKIQKVGVDIALLSLGAQKRSSKKSEFPKFNNPR